MAAKKAVCRKGLREVEAVVVGAPAKPLKPAQCRGYMRKKLAEAFPGIVDGFVKEATAGSCAHVKLASELLEKPAKQPVRRKGSAQRMLEKLGTF